MAQNALTKKYGPLPGWAWLAALAIGVYFYHRNAVNSSNTPTGSSDPNAVDPSTGLTYGQEAAGVPAFGTGAASDLGSTGGSGQITPTVTADGSPTGTPTDLTGGFLDQLQGFQEIAAALGYNRADTSGSVSEPSATVKAATSGPSSGLRAVGHSVRYRGPGKYVPIASGKTTGGKGKPPARPKTTGKKANARSGQRAPAHPNEQAHAVAPSHLREPAASTRVTPRVAPKKPAARKPAKRR